MKVDEEIENYICSLVKAFEAIKEIWLFGSRANNTFNPASDWDLIVFADYATLSAMQNHPELEKQKIDLLVVHNGDDFICPWGDPPKGGDLKGWEWQKSSEAEAEYTQAKFIDDEESSREFNALMGYVRLTRKKAIRVWPPMTPNTPLEQAR